MKQRNLTTFIGESKNNRREPLEVAGSPFSYSKRIILYKRGLTSGPGEFAS